MKPASFFKNLSDKNVQCTLCPHNCIIAPNKHGRCNVRKNIDGVLYSLNYQYPAAINIDPVEKKPLYHFLPGTKTFSFGCAGCNLKCSFCQNCTISQVLPDEIETEQCTSEELVKAAIHKKCESISFTYSEPTIFYETMIETAELAHKYGLKTIMVSNGFINREPLEKLLPFIDAANIDIKGFTEEFYRKYTGASLAPVLETLKTMKKAAVHIEITNLIIPKANDSKEEIDDLIKWVRDNLGSDTPLHFSRFFPQYKLTDRTATPPQTIITACERASSLGLKFVYAGNMESIWTKK
ncbi:MAG: AmmeMemoRadiSam system radical SAM enzyme [Fibrobacteres bacterium]|nr:AmmeMemoRadiSam system radical SAM enzyme [Fibrobacterota bacterium]